MVQFLSINFFSWISSIFVGFFKSSHFFVSQCVCVHTNEMCWKFPTQQQTLGRPVWHGHQLIYVAPELYHFHIPAGSSLERTSQLSPSESKRSEKLWDFHQIARSVGCVEMTSSSAASHLHGELCSDRTILCCIGGCFCMDKMLSTERDVLCMLMLVSKPHLNYDGMPELLYTYSYLTFIWPVFAYENSRTKNTSRN